MSAARASTGRPGELATGGTLFGNALSMAAARAALTELLTRGAYARAARLGARSPTVWRPLSRRPACPGGSSVSAPRSAASSFSGRLARSAAEADDDEQPELNALLRMYLANRGIWEAISTAGPTMSLAATDDDVTAYLAAFGEFVGDVRGARTMIGPMVGQLPSKGNEITAPREQSD